jgi:hypothetical protein
MEDTIQRHTAQGSLLMRRMLTERSGEFSLVSTPASVLCCSLY